MLGKTLSHYRIIEKIGAGGMGEVYLAEDTKLHRNVALKILPAELASDERRSRFEREAQAVAALNHPNIVHVYSVEAAEDVHFITMELVKGKTLTKLIPKKGMSLNKFFEIAIPLADAVSAAHEQGIIHRDLKPDNLMVGDDGRLKILDFGLAKLKPEHEESGISELPTQSATAEGRILGTVAYMSPEQAEGKKIDSRSDIFSIGIILYEMATGERPFKGDTAASLLSSILRDTPQSASEAKPGLPRDLGRIVRRCLAKDWTRRYQSALDVRNELEELKLEVDSGEMSEGLPTTGSKKGWLVPAVVAVVALVAGVVGYHLRSGVVSNEATESPVEGSFTQLTSLPGQELFPSISTDGEYFIYSSDVSGNWDVYLQRVGGERAINLTANSLEDDTQPAYSPDGKQIAFRSERDGGGIFLMGATGESVRRLTDFGFNPSWSPDGQDIAFTTEPITDPLDRLAKSQLWAVSTETGEKRILSESDAVQATWSPSGKRIAFWSIYNAAGERTAVRNIWTIRATGGDLLQVTDDDYIDWNPRWSPDGEYLYFSSDRGGSMNVWRVLIDDESGRVLAEPEAITTGASASRQHMDFDGNGSRVIYVERNVFMDIWKVAFEPESRRVVGTPIPVTRGSRNLTHPDVSHDGEWLACRATDEQEDIVIIRTDGTDRRQLTDDLHKDRIPQWSPDGKKIAFYSNRSGSYDIWTINSDGSGLKQLTVTPGKSVNLPTWSPGGTHLAYFNRSDGRTYIFDAEKPWEAQTPQQLPTLSDHQVRFEVTSWSPSGKRLAGYGSHETTGAEIGKIFTYSIESQKFEELSAFGTAPTWLDDHSLLFRDLHSMYLAELPSGNTRKLLSLTPDRIRYFMSASTDKRWIYFTGAKMEADIWMLTLSEEQ